MFAINETSKRIQDEVTAKANDLVKRFSTEELTVVSNFLNHLYITKEQFEEDKDYYDTDAILKLTATVAALEMCVDKALGKSDET